MAARSQQLLLTSLAEEVQALHKNFAALIDSARIRCTENADHEELANTINRERLHSKVHTENIVSSIQSILSIIFELKMAYALYDFVSLAQRQKELVKTLETQTISNKAVVQKIAYEVAQTLGQLHKSLQSSTI